MSNKTELMVGYDLVQDLEVLRGYCINYSAAVGMLNNIECNLTKFESCLAKVE